MKVRSAKREMGTAIQLCGHRAALPQGASSSLVWPSRITESEYNINHQIDHRVQLRAAQVKETARL